MKTKVPRKSKLTPFLTDRRVCVEFSLACTRRLSEGLNQGTQVYQAIKAAIATTEAWLSQPSETKETEDKATRAVVNLMGVISDSNVTLSTAEIGASIAAIGTLTATYTKQYVDSAATVAKAARKAASYAEENWQVNMLGALTKKPDSSAPAANAFLKDPSLLASLMPCEPSQEELT